MGLKKMAEYAKVAEPYLGYRLMVGQRPLKPLIGVRIPVPQPV